MSENKELESEVDQVPEKKESSADLLRKIRNLADMATTDTRPGSAQDALREIARIARKLIKE